MHKRHERDTGRVSAQSSASHIKGEKSVRSEQVQLERVPSPFRTDSQQDAFTRTSPCKPHIGGNSARVGNQTVTARKKRCQVVFDQNAELFVDRHAREPRVARLLKPLDEQRPVTRFAEHVRVEVIAFDACGIRQDDLADAERRQLSPEPAQHFRAWQCQQQIHARS